MIAPLRLGYHKLVHPVFGLPVYLHFVFHRAIGEAYGVGPLQKSRLVLRFRRNTKRVPTLSTLREHLELAAALLEAPAALEGDVIECGCYEGGSTVNLSLVCALTGRRLVVCDSFEGLPPPDEDDRVHYNAYTDHTDLYEEGRFAAPLERVRATIARYGSIDACDFVVGYFDESLSELDRRYVLAFLDVDLVASLKPCLVAIWPTLAAGCKLFVHEARSLALVSLFFDNVWWRTNVGVDAPGFIGAGTGLPLDVGRGSELGYARKEPAHAG